MCLVLFYSVCFVVCVLLRASRNNASGSCVGGRPAHHRTCFGYSPPQEVTCELSIHAAFRRNAISRLLAGTKWEAIYAVQPKTSVLFRHIIVNEYKMALSRRPDATT